MVVVVIVLSVLRGRDPSAVAVLMEDSAALAGVFLAGSALALTHITGSVYYDAMGSITIGGEVVGGTGGHRCRRLWVH